MIDPKDVTHVLHAMEQIRHLWDCMNQDWKNLPPLVQEAILSGLGFARNQDWKRIKPRMKEAWERRRRPRPQE